SAPPVRLGPPRLGPGPGPAARREARADPRHAALAHPRAARLPVPSSLPRPPPDLRPRAAGAQVRRPRSPGRVRARPGGGRAREGPHQRSPRRAHGGGLMATQAPAPSPAGVPAPSDALLSVRGLQKHFPIRGGILRREVGSVKAVDGVDFDIRPGETLGLVGESGCGKSTTARLILRLIEPTAGSVLFDGVDVVKAGKDQMRRLREQMQIVFQDPYASLNPRMTVGSVVAEPLVVHGGAGGYSASARRERKERVRRLLETVGLNPEHYNRYPHEVSRRHR